MKRTLLRGLQALLGLALLWQSLQLAQALDWLHADALRLSAQLGPALLLKIILIALNALAFWRTRRARIRAQRPAST